MPPGRVARSERSSVPEPPVSTTTSTPTPSVEHYPVPLRRRLIVDGLVRPQTAGPDQLLVAAAGDDHPGAHGLGQLEGEEGHTPGAQGENGLARLQAPFGDQGTPRGQGGDRERGGLGKRVVVGDGQYRLSRQDHLLGRQTRPRCAQGRLDVPTTERTVDPIGDEVGNDAITDGHSIHVRSDCGDDTGSIADGHGRQGQLRVVAPVDHHQVSVV